MTTLHNNARYDGYTANWAKTISIFGAIGSIKASYNDTNGAFCLLELTVPPHFRGITAHWHAETTEAFYVLDGTLAFTLAEQTFTVTRSGFVLAPPRTVHQFWNPTAAPATLLNIYTPAGCEAYFEALAGAFAQTSADPEQLMALAAQYDQFPPPVPTAPLPA